MSILSINGISKAYGPVQALKSVSFTVPEGCVFGVLGPNGSGKTTLLGILLDVLKANSGSYNWLGGMQPHEARRHIGALLETPNFYHYMSAWDNLEITAAIRGRGLEDRERVLKLVRLWERKDSKFSTYSLGMKQRLAIGAALLGNPKVLVLDEPTNGLDPVGIAEIRTLIKDLSKEGITIIMASHLLDEVEKVCTHVAVLKQGTLLTTGPVEEAMSSERGIEISAQDIFSLGSIISAMPGVLRIAEHNNMLLVYSNESLTPEAVNRYCAEKGVFLSHLALHRKSLEATFMELTGGQSAASN